jgi:ferredoxin
MKITVDYDRCEGHGVCAAVAPDLFRLDDHGDLVLLATDGRVPAGQRDPATNSVLTCPVGALRMEG